MGREIRRVPLDWQHPTNERGFYIPLFDKTYDEAAAEWEKASQQFYTELSELTEEERTEVFGEVRDYAEWDGGPPEREWYRPAFAVGTDIGYQIYETVTEGTPVSPVFATLDELKDWLVDQGYLPSAAARFAEIGAAPSFTMVRDEAGVRFSDGIASLSELGERGDG